MFSQFSLKQKLAAAGLLIAIVAIALAVHFAPLHNTGVEMADPLCPTVCPPPH